ncbi:uncharacterized protein L201_001314 [Kwoniella dendrophila CBS 6074]|uniref:HMG box domain-containing protein n=1 Tax=Kwoniella dendrophila CBS 6074 TaxID=1295534 RepID=A0AAX4JLX4_9TREE
MSFSISTVTSASSQATGSPAPSSSYVELPELEFDLHAFLQSCSEFMSQPLTPSPIFDVPLILPDPAVTTPPYTSDEGSVTGDSEHLTEKQYLCPIIISPTTVIAPQLAFNMPSSKHFNAYQSPELSNPSSSSSSLRPFQSGSSSQSQSPPLSYSYSNPNIFASYPQSYPASSSTYFPQQEQQNLIPPPPASIPNSPPWQTTDTEANASGLDVDIDLEGLTDDNTDIKTSYSTTTPSKSKLTSTKDAIPRPPNAWILYRSDILKDLASGNDIPGLDAVLTKMGYNTTSASSDESQTESSSNNKGKSKATTDSEMMPPPGGLKKKSTKKGSKAPTEEFLSLGKGKTGKGLPQAHISKLISTLWKNETEERKAQYEQRADLKKMEHQKKYPDYKFQPMRKADKIRQREDREREKEELKRQKEAAKQAGKAKRHQRRRNRVSPTSPYAVRESSKRPDMGSLARSLSYSGEPVKPEPGTQWWSAIPNAYSYGGPRRETEPAPATYAYGNDPMGLYPFPVPMNSLPSLTRDPGLEDEGPPGAMIAEDYHSWQQSQNQGQSRPQPLPHTIPSVSVTPVENNTPDLLSAPSMSQQSSSDTYSAVSSSSHTDSSTSSALPQPSSHADHSLQGLGIYPSMHSAVPFIADPLPMDAQGRPMPILGFDDIQPLADNDNGDPAMLAEMWWNLQDDDVEDDLKNNSIPSGLLADSRTLQSYDIEAEQAGQSSVPRLSMSSTVPSSGAASGAPPTPSSNFLAQQPFQLADGGAAYPYPQGYVPMYVSVIPEDGNIDPSIPFFTPGYDANLSYLPMDATFDPSLYTQNGISFEEQGPFLSAQQPLSPTETWSAGPTPREATFPLLATQTQSQDNSDRIPSNSSQGTVRTVSSGNNSNQTVPRYVSNSAYPLTPLSQDPTSLPNTNGIVDRNTSYSALAAVMGQSMGMGMGMGMGQSDDMLGWDDNDVIEHDEEDDSIIQQQQQQQKQQYYQPRKERVISQIHHPHRVITPISGSTPSVMGLPVHQQQLQQSFPILTKSDTTNAPRKINTRSRTVASKFGGA